MSDASSFGSGPSPAVNGSQHDLEPGGGDRHITRGDSGSRGLTVDVGAIDPTTDVEHKGRRPQRPMEEEP